MNKHLIWSITFVLIISIVCGTAVWINYNSWTIRIEIDDNTLEAINKTLQFHLFNNSNGNEIIEFKCYAVEHQVYRLWDYKNNLILNETIDTGFVFENIECPDFINTKGGEHE